MSEILWADIVEMLCEIMDHVFVVMVGDRKFDSELQHVLAEEGHPRRAVRYRDLVNGILPENRVIQPANRGTAPAILYERPRLAKVARDACVAMFPSDHFVSDDREFMRRVDLAFDAIGSRPEMTALLGITPHAVESGYGRIEPGELVAMRAPLFRVRRSCEKPGNEVAGKLLDAGCILNSFVMAARVSTLIGLIMIAMPELFASFSKIRGLLGTTREPGGLETLYERTATASFSDEVLEP
jgi:mannose-1-phosphate guanylyltransferase